MPCSNTTMGVAYTQKSEINLAFVTAGIDRGLFYLKRVPKRKRNIVK